MNSVTQRSLVPTMRRTLKRLELGCATREAWMLRRPLMRSPDCGYSSTASSRYMSCSTSKSFASEAAQWRLSAFRISVSSMLLLPFRVIEAQPRSSRAVTGRLGTRPGSRTPWRRETCTKRHFPDRPPGYLFRRLSVAAGTYLAFRRCLPHPRCRHDHSAPDVRRFIHCRRCRLQQFQRRRFEASIIEYNRGPTWRDGRLQQRDATTLPMRGSVAMSPSLIDRWTNA